MLPITENLDDLIADFEEDEQIRTQTYGINLTENIMGGRIDELDAVKQMIYLTLSVESDKFIIYPYTYGVQLLDLIGKPSHYVAAVLPDRIRDALITDSRVLDVTDFEFEINRNKLTAKFVVHTIYGNIEEETVVNY